MKKPKIVGDPKNGYLSQIEHCSYCGGRKIYTVGPEKNPTDFYQFHLQDQTVTPPVTRAVCMRCAMRLLDKVLGKPQDIK